MSDPDCAPGAVTYHSSDEDGYPDVGISIGIGDGCQLWIGELLTSDGANTGFAFYGPGFRDVASFDDYDTVRDLFEVRLAPRLRALAKGNDNES